MTLGSLFAGIGGFELAATWAGIEPVWSNEIDNFACDVLRKNFTHEIIQKDIREIGKHNLPGVDIISGGEPCQPHSVSGLQKGVSDIRYLWPEYFRCVDEFRPRYVVNENVFGSISNGTLDKKMDDLESIGYTCWPPIVIPANFMGAWHKRKRIWLVAYSDGKRREGTVYNNTDWIIKTSQPQITLDTHSNPFLQFTQSVGQPAIFGVADGIPKRMDIVGRLSGMGNSIVPQIAYGLFQAIKIVDKSVNDS